MILSAVVLIGRYLMAKNMECSMNHVPVKVLVLGSSDTEAEDDEPVSSSHTQVPSECPTV